MPLAELERDLAAHLTGRGALPGAGWDAAALDRARTGLIAKRRQAARHLLPRTAAALGESWPARFAAHAGTYTPGGLLNHVDDAWELATTLRRKGAARPEVQGAAHDDLVDLRLRYVRRRSPGLHRIRERRGWLVAIVRSPVRKLVLRLPGARGRVVVVRM